MTDPSTDAGRFREDVRALVERDGVGMIIPATDTSALPLLALRASDGPLIAFPEERAYLDVSDKRHLMDVAPRLGVAVPPQVVLESPGTDQTEVCAFARSRRFDVVLKPCRSAVLRGEAVDRFSVTLVGTEEELRAGIASYAPEAYPLLVQERIAGPGLGAFMLTRHGEPIASFAHRRIREKPPTGGVSVYRESVPLREDIRAAAEAVLAHFAWTGVAMVEFKEDRVTGTPFLMEVNGRFWGSLQLAVDAGVDFPSLLARMTAGEAVEPVYTYRAGVRSRWLWGDVDHLLWVLRRGAAYRDTLPEIASPVRALGRFLCLWRPGDRFEVLRPSDPAPFLRESMNWLRGAFGGP